MKHTLLISVLSATLLCSHSAQAQIPVVSKVVPKVTVGLKLGANFQSLDGVGYDKGYKPGIAGGLFVGLSKNKMGVQAEGLIKTVKFSSSASSTAYINALYIDVPVLFQYKIVNRLWAQAGPQFSILASAKDQNSDDKKENYKTTDISGVLGLQAILPVHLIAGARYIYGFSDINNVSAITSTIKNRSFQIYLGFRFL